MDLSVDYFLDLLFGLKSDYRAKCSLTVQNAMIFIFIMTEDEKILEFQK